MKFTEKTLSNYAAPLGATAEEKCKESITNTKNALRRIGYSSSTDEYRTLFEGSYAYFSEMQHGYNGRRIKIFTQGSYANDTNITKTSDVDIAVVTETTFMLDRPIVLNESTIKEVRTIYNFSKSTDTVTSLKDDVEVALKDYFGDNYVIRKNKSIKVLGNNIRTDTDVVPAMRNRDYSNDKLLVENNFIGGIYIQADDREVVVNYPEQHIQNGIAKNKHTNSNFKKCVRIIKNIKEIMPDYGYEVSDDVTSFGLESLLWNVDVSAYKRYSSILRYTFDEVLKFLCNSTGSYDGYMEVNAIKRLFPTIALKQKYITFIMDIKEFFEYDITEA
jgi:predicted nucleotidyltransferase